MQLALPQTLTIAPALSRNCPNTEQSNTPVNADPDKPLRKQGPRPHVHFGPL